MYTYAHIAKQELSSGAEEQKIKEEGMYIVSDEIEIMSVEDALAYIRLHFTESNGLIAQIEQGGHINKEQVLKLEIALKRIHSPGKISISFRSKM